MLTLGSTLTDFSGLSCAHGTEKSLKSLLSISEVLFKSELQFSKVSSLENNILFINLSVLLQLSVANFSLDNLPSIATRLELRF